METFRQYQHVMLSGEEMTSIRQKVRRRAYVDRTFSTPYISPPSELNFRQDFLQNRGWIVPYALARSESDGFRNIVLTDAFGRRAHSPSRTLYLPIV